MDKPLMSLLPLLALLLPAVQAGESSWRAPRGDIINTGMLKAEVLARAGPPAYSETLDCGHHGGGNESAFYYFVGSGPNREAVTLRFNGLRLTDIDQQLIR
jgi:hypothetical protein